MKLHRFLSTLAFSGLLAAGAHAADKLSVAASPIPHGEILEFVKPVLAKQGVQLDIKIFTDYVQPNLQVVDGALDANFFQHRPYMTAFNKEHKTNFVDVGNVHVEPFGAYSKKLKKGQAIPRGAVVAIPNDPANAARALLLIEKQGLIKLKDSNNLFSTAKDIVSNPKKLKFKELEAATLPRVLPDVTFALINANYALEAGLNPVKDSLFIESADSPYANFVSTIEQNKDLPALKKLVNVLQTPAVKQFILDRYKGAVVPAFD